ncbi:MAG: hypothetical protein K2M55_09110 [Muribaculaceae bacterium]|nr:hypothetical protein [Muribaculaceae bacterium]
MKKTLISALLITAAMGASAQLVEINSMQKVSLPEGLYINVPTISPDGSFVLASDLAGDGLTQIPLDGSAVRVVTSNASGYDVRISDDSRNVVFRQSTTGADHLRYTALKAVDLATGVETELVKPTRHLNSGVSIKSGAVTAVENGRARARAINGGTATLEPTVSISYGHLVYTDAQGNATTLDPQGRGSYLWPQLSPDGTKVVYYLSGYGCYVCNTDGSNPAPLGLLRAAKWLGNDMLVGMNDVDNGEYTTSSAIIATDLNGTRQQLTTDETIAMFPSVSADGRRIAFSTPEGELYIINLK